MKECFAGSISVWPCILFVWPWILVTLFNSIRLQLQQAVVGRNFQLSDERALYTEPSSMNKISRQARYQPDLVEVALQIRHQRPPRNSL
mmetsp:Transcript_25932/g.61649  ORF Transcript_25932/g.61649 Transcript_25932/m.61649 type:complete len:89 (-) Transcript_25932:667-933(-)